MAKANGPAVCKVCRAEALTRATLIDAPYVAPKRPAPYPGPRCATHHRAEQKRRKAAAHDRYVQVTYGAEPGWYDRMYEFQGGRCAICPRAIGTTKRLAVDHDHKLEETINDPRRGLLCGPCNSMLAHCRDDVEMLLRAVAYLQNPPARQMREST